MRPAIDFRCFVSLCEGRFRQCLLLALLSAAALVASGCGRHEPVHSEQGPVEVTVLSVTPGDVPVTFEFIAQVQSSRQVNIQARVSGFLDKRVYTEGSLVKEGQTLFVMDQKPFKATLDQYKAALARHEAALEVARRNLARVKPLTALNALSQKDLDDAIGEFQSASAAVEGAKAEVEQARLNLSYTVIKSPVDGISSYAQQADGTYLHASNSQLTTVAVISPIYINFSISENDWLKYRSHVARGMLIEPKDKSFVAEAVLVDGTVYPHTGKVTFADPSFNAKTGTFLMRATVDNPDGLLRPNQYVRIRLKGAVRHNAILVPQRAVQQTARGHIVWVAGEDNKAEARPVTVGPWHENDWFIDEGLQAGDRVVVDGVLLLQPGSPLKVVESSDKTKPDGGRPDAQDRQKNGGQKGTEKQ